VRRVMLLQDAARLASDIRQYICKYLQAMLLLQASWQAAQSLKLVQCTPQ
jgi:hypothetical protein